MKHLLILFGTLTLACGSYHRPPAAPAPQDSFAIVVVNHHWLDVTVYLVHDGQRTRVGTVTATTTQQFDLSARLLGATRRGFGRSGREGSTGEACSGGLPVPGSVVMLVCGKPVNRPEPGCPLLRHFLSVRRN